MLANRLLPDWSCDTCTAMLKKRRGCDADSVLKPPKMFDGEEMLRCPLRPVLDNGREITAIFRAWSWREKGYLPDEGTWRDQTLRFVDLMAVIDRAQMDAMEDRGKPGGGTGT